MNILAIDQATVTGWCISNDIYGTWNFAIRKDESAGMKWLRFKAKLKEVHELQKLDLIVYERVAGQYKNALIHSAKMVAMIETFCEENGIEYRAYSAAEIKKFATGKGNANKDAMVKAARERLGYDGDDDNEADALWILNLAQLDLGVDVIGTHIKSVGPKID